MHSVTLLKLTDTREKPEGTYIADSPIIRFGKQNKEKIMDPSTCVELS